MGFLLTIGCYMVTFGPSLALFCRFILKDPLRIILFVLGAFFWLVSLLIAALVWLAMKSTVGDCLPAAIGSFILAQEGARVLYFWLLKQAQSGLNKITRPGTESIAPGVSDLHNARHMLALVCGLGMGVMSALFLVMNVFADFSGPGTVGLPMALKNNSHNVNSAGMFLPLLYAISGCSLTMLHVTWTIMVWDSCHKIKQHSTWFIPAAVALCSHYVLSGSSIQFELGHNLTSLIVQLVILLGSIVYAHTIIGGSIGSLGNGILSALKDWVTLSYLRAWLKKPASTVLLREDADTADDRVIRT